MEKHINGAAVPQDMDRLSVMRRVLEGMPETTLIVFMAHRVEGKRYAEIAQEMGISEWRVERHMMRAIGRIADMGARYRTAFSALDPLSRQVLELAWDGLSHGPPEQHSIDAKHWTPNRKTRRVYTAPVRSAHRPHPRGLPHDRHRALKTLRTHQGRRDRNYQGRQQYACHRSRAPSVPRQMPGAEQFMTARLM